MHIESLPDLEESPAEVTVTGIIWQPTVKGEGPHRFGPPRGHRYGLPPTEPSTRKARTKYRQ
ncbi:hypothetical protein ACWCHM_29545 [Micromonospora sp. SCSIO 07396]